MLYCASLLEVVCSKLDDEALSRRELTLTVTLCETLRCVSDALAVCRFRLAMLAHRAWSTLDVKLQKQCEFRRILDVVLCEVGPASCV